MLNADKVKEDKKIKHLKLNYEISRSLEREFKKKNFRQYNILFSTKGA